MKKRLAVLAIVGIVLFAIWNHADVAVRATPEAASNSISAHNPSQAQASEGQRGVLLATDENHVLPNKNTRTPRAAISKDPITEQIETLFLMDLCDDPSLRKSLSAQKIIEHAKLGSSRRAAEISERQLKKLCANAQLGVLDDPSIRHHDAIVYLNSELAQEVAAFIDVLREDEEAGAKSVTDEKTREFVIAAIRSSTSHFELFEILKWFQQASILAPSLSRFRYPTDLDDEQSAAASVVAGCRIFGDCGPQSAYAAALCFVQCEREMGVEELSLSYIGEADRASVESAVNAIIRARFN